MGNAAKLIDCLCYTTNLYITKLEQKMEGQLLTDTSESWNDIVETDAVQLECEDTQRMRKVANSGKLTKLPEMFLFLAQDHQIMRLRHPMGDIDKTEYHTFLKLNVSNLHMLFCWIETAIYHFKYKKLKLSEKSRLFDFFSLSDIIAGGNAGLKKLDIYIIPVLMRIESTKQKQLIVRKFHINVNGDVHLPKDKVIHDINQLYYWEGMRNDVENFVKGCEVCKQKAKKRREILQLEKKLNKCLKRLYVLEGVGREIAGVLAEGVQKNM